MTTTTPSKPAPRAGQAWTVGESLVALLAATPMEVVAVRGGLVHFTTASGVLVRLPVQVFRGLFDVVPS